MKYLSENRIAAHILGQAIKALFPQAPLAGSALLEYGFSNAFYSPHELPKEFLSLLEEKMRGLAKVAAFRTQEMVPSNAAAFLKSKTEPRLAEIAAQSKNPLISIILADNYIDIDLGLPKNLVPLEFSLLKMEKRGDVVVVEGIARSNQPALKTFLKNWKKRERFLQGKNTEFFLYNCHPILLETGKEELDRLFKKVIAWRSPFRPIISKHLGDEREGPLISFANRDRFHWNEELGDLVIIKPEGIEEEIERWHRRLSSERFPIVWQYEKRNQILSSSPEPPNILPELTRNRGILRACWVDPLDKEWPLCEIVNAKKGYLTSSLLLRPIEYLVETKISLAMVT